MSLHPRNEGTNRFPLFKEIFKNIENCKILDFGGNRGNLLYFSNKEILEENYTCIDVSSEALELGKFEFPNAKFTHYDRFNWMYNHHGDIRYSFPKIDTKYDLIWAYSVFSHTDFSELLFTLKWLMCLDFKKLAISVLDINGAEMMEFFYNKRVKEYGNCIEIKPLKDNKILYFIDNSKLVTDQQKFIEENFKYFLAFYDLNWLENTLNTEGIPVRVIKPGNGYVPFLFIEK